MASGPGVRAGIDWPRPPRELTVAAGVGLGVGVFAAGTAYYFYASTGGPTLPGVAVIPLSFLIVAIGHVVLTRRRKARASDWLALGYTAAILLSIVLLTIGEALSEFWAELNQTVW
jgi:hypothetical protein